jgi:hypothetical protein
MGATVDHLFGDNLLEGLRGTGCRTGFLFGFYTQENGFCMVSMVTIFISAIELKSSS